MGVEEQLRAGRGRELAGFGFAVDEDGRVLCAGADWRRGHAEVSES